MPRLSRRKPHQELYQTMSAGCRGGLKSLLPLPTLYWHQQWHTKILKALLVFLAYSCKYLEINTFHMNKEKSRCWLW